MKVIIADDHAVVRQGFKVLLDYQPNIQVVGLAADGQEAHRLVGELRPDIILLDVSMPPGESGIVAAGRIHTDYPETKIIMLTMYDDREYMLYTIQNGASGYVLKNAPEEDLLEAIQTVYGGGVYISREMVPYLVEGFVSRHREDSAGLLTLADREIEVLTLVARGYGNKEIADKLFLSVKTVESYKAKIMCKLDLKTRPELVEYAIKKKLLQI